MPARAHYEGWTSIESAHASPFFFRRADASARIQTSCGEDQSNELVLARARRGGHRICLADGFMARLTRFGSSAPAKFDPAVRPEFSEPVVLASKDGVLEVRLTAHQGEARLDTVATPVKNLLVFGYEVIRGTASNGQMSGDNLYPAPTLQVFPGETLIVHLDNALTGLTIRDFFDPQYTPKGEEVPLYPAQMTVVAAQPAHSRRACQPEGQLRQRDAAHPGRDVEHLHLPHPQEHAAGRLLVSQPSARADDAARLLRAGGPARDRPHRRQPAAGHASTTSRSGTWCCSTTSCSIGRAGCAQTQQSNLAAMGQHDQAAGRRRAGEGHVSAAARAGQFHAIEKGNAILHRLVRGPAVDPATSADASSSSRAICSASRRIPAARARTSPADPIAARLSSATCSSRSTASSSR